MAPALLKSRIVRLRCPKTDRAVCVQRWKTLILTDKQYLYRRDSSNIQELRTAIGPAGPPVGPYFSRENHPPEPLSLRLMKHIKVNIDPIHQHLN